MKTSKMKMPRSAWMLFSGLAALLLVMGLSLLLSHLQVAAQPRVEETAVLTVAKEVDTNQVAPGGTLAYTITVRNTSGDSVQAWMTDTLPDDLTLVSGPYTFLADSNVGVKDEVITWSHTLAGAQYDEITFMAQVLTDTSATEIKNVAQVTGTGSLITDSATTHIQTALDNEGTYKTVDRDTVAPGNTLAYTIVLSNSYTSEAVFAEIVDPLDSLLDYVDGSARTIPDSSGTLGFFDTQVGSTGITWTVIVSPSSSVALSFQAVVSDSAADGTVIDNTATIHEGSNSFTRSIPVTVTQRPASQIRSPNRDAYITKKGTLTISGIAWLGGTEPPYLTDDPHLSLQRVNENTYYVRWTDVVSATDYILEEATQPDFDDASSFPPTEETNYLFGDKGNGTYYYRVQALNPDVETPSRWSNVESVKVPWSEASASASDSALSAEEMSNGSATVQVRIDDGDWHTATVTETTWGGWEWSWDWSLPEEHVTQHVIQSRAAESGGSFGSVDAITVTLENKDYFVHLPFVARRWPPIPYPPELSLTGKENIRDDTYTLSWTYSDDSPGVEDPDDYSGDSYKLQEATKSDFSDAEDIYVGSNKSYQVTGQEDGTFYYRVRGYNSYGKSEWSNVKSATVESFSYFDDFSDYQSGWPREWSDSRGALYQVRPYEHPQCGPDESCKYEKGDGYVIARRSGGDPQAQFSPGVAIPSANYEMTLKARWFDGRWYATYQIIFGANEALDAFYSVEVRLNDIYHTCAYRVKKNTVDGGEILRNWQDEDIIDCREYLNGEDASWSKWRIRREDDWIIVHVNGKHLGSWEDSSFGANRYFGVGATLYEGFTPSKPQFDDWSVELID